MKSIVYRLFTLVLSSLLLAIASCEDEMNSPKFEMLTQLVTSPAGGGEYSVAYSLDNPITGEEIKCSSGDAEWVSGFDTSESGKITFIVSSNNVPEERTCTVTASYAGIDKSFSVTQWAADPERPVFIIEDKEVSIGEEGGTATIRYSLENEITDGKIIVESSEDWAKEFDLSTKGSISFKVEENTSRARCAILKIWYEDILQVATVNQERAEPIFELEEDEIIIEYGAGSTSVGYQITNPVPGERIFFTKDADWIYSIQETDEDRIEFHFTMNKSSERTATIIAEYAGIEKTFKVTQREIDIQSISLDRGKAILIPGEKQTLTVSLYPEGDLSDMIEWSSSNTSIITVKNDGTITALAEGTATVQAKILGHSASCEIIVCEKPEIGSYYYSDGTFSKEKRTDKEIIGVVFWTGDPTNDDSTLKRDHPWCRHGLVIALSEASSRWQEGYLVYQNTVADWAEKNMPDCFSTLTPYDGLEPNYFNKTTGYNNTKIIEAFNKDPENSDWIVNAFSVIENHRSNVPAPETTSDWYMPSTKDASLFISGEYDGNIREIENLYTVRDILNPILYRIEGGSYIGSSGIFYWTSSEYNHLQAYIVAATTGKVFGYMKQLKIAMVRPILAF